MWPVAIAAGAQLAGGLITNQGNMAAVDKSADRAQANAREQMAFQERMSSSAIQRAKADAKAAGMNPLIAMTQPSSTPSGAAGGVEAAKLDNPASHLATTAMEASRLKQQKEMNDSQMGVNAASIKQANATTAKSMAETSLMMKDINKKDLVDRAARTANKMIDAVSSSAKTLRNLDPSLSDFVPRIKGGQEFKDAIKTNQLRKQWKQKINQKLP